MYIAVEAATAILEMLVLSIYLKGLYEDYVKEPIIVWAAYVLTGILLFLLNIVLDVPLILLSFRFVAFLVLAILLSGAKWMNAFYSSLLLCAISIIGEYMVSGIMILFGISADSLEVFGNSRVLYIVFTKLVQFFLVFLVIRVSKWKRSQDSLIEAVPLLLSQVFSIFVSYFMYQGTLNSNIQFSWSFIIGAVGILYINVVIFMYVERIKEVGEMKRQNELADLQYQSKVEYFNQVQNDQDETRALWHDIKKYMSTINELINMNDIPHAKACIAQVTDLFEGTGHVVNVGNTIVSAVLNASIQKARRLNIETELDIRVQPDLNISAADLSVIIGNTIDNAAEACATLEEGEKKISIQLIQRGAMLYYEINNPYQRDQQLEKENPKLHGYGLKNVKRCLDTYQGTMTTYASDTHFSVSIHMNIPTAQKSAQLIS